MNKCQCWVTISEDDERFEIWKKVVSDVKIPLIHPFAITMDGVAGVKSFYQGDSSKLSEEQKEILAREMSIKFGIPVFVIRADLKQRNTVPILVNNCTVSVCNHHMRLML